ncbi:MAG: GMP/IMP nucleotidase [Gammaproteobacteria bacterium]|nr:MAG: GMP/IMP nucleotidase [Gammaproteobacteria bacterium]
MIDWRGIDTVLLDMDGTLLDLHFDNHFWLEFVPARYAARHGLTFDEARRECLARYEKVAGTLAWYSIDHWTEELGLDIALLKEEVDHLIQVLPHVTEFLDLLGRAGKRRVLVTNAHQKSLALKMERTQLHHRLDALISAHDIGLAKETPGFWDRVRESESFDPGRALFIDDSLSVLRAARDYGIAQLLAIRHPDRSQPVREIDEFPAVVDFDEVIPGLRRSTEIGGVKR